MTLFRCDVMLRLAVTSNIKTLQYDILDFKPCINVASYMQKIDRVLRVLV